MALCIQRLRRKALPRLLFVVSFLSLLTGLPARAQAQRCGVGLDGYNLFLLDIREAGSDRQARGWEVTLTDANRKVIEEIAAPKNLASAGLKTFAWLGDYHMVRIHGNVPRTKLPPVYFARLVRGDDTAYHRLYFERSIPICPNNLHQKSATPREFTDEGGNKARAISIDPGKPAPVMNAQRPPHPDSLFLRLEYVDSAGFCALARARLVDYQSHRTVQVFAPSRRIWSGCNRSKENPNPNVQLVHFFGERNLNVPDLVVRTLVLPSQVPYNPDYYADYFRFDESQNLYIRIEALSEVPNVWRDTNGIFRRIEHVDSADWYLQVEYIFDGNQWLRGPIVFRDRTLEWKQERIARLEKIQQLSSCVRVSGPEQRTRLRVLPYNVSAVVFTDTFHIRNTCMKRFDLEWNVSPGPELDVSPVIGPGSYLHAVMRFRVNMHPGDVQQHTTGLRLGVKGGPGERFVFDYFLISADALQTRRAGMITYTKAFNSHKPTSFAVQADSLGRPIAYGQISRSGSRTGYWNILDTNGVRMKGVSYGSFFFLQPQNPEAADSLSFYLTSDGAEEIQAESFRASGGHYVFFPPGFSGQLLIRGDSSTATLRIVPATFQNQNFLAYWLLKSGAVGLFDGTQEVPIRFQPAQYAIHWETGAWKDIVTGAAMIRESLQRALRGNTQAIVLSDEEILHMRLLDLSRCTPSEQARILSALKSDPKIALISRRVVYGNHPETHADRSISIVWDPNTVPTRFSDTVLALGFIDHNQSWGTTHTYQARWKNNVIDEAYYRALEQLARHPSVLRVNPHFFYRAYPEEQLQER